MLKKIVLFLLLSVPCIVNAQFTSVKITVDGLTCAACSYATQKSVLQLDFVDSIKMDLNTHVATITFKPNKKVSISLISKKVYDAGFSVGSLTALFNFDSYKVSAGSCFDFADDIYHFEKVNDQTLSGPVSLKFIGEKYMEKSEYKKQKALMLPENCKKAEKFSGKIYNVTIE